ncbi:MAG: DUF5011 domain-containing protein [Opitutae bacterium]|nr:DUF5011 domain-containing protein [Opitutae bacterium]
MNKGKPYNPYLAKPITIIFLILFWILGGCISVPKIIPEAKSLTISTDPAGASISVNGEYVGLSPTLYKIKNRPYSLVVRAEKQGFPVKISDVARTGGVFPQNINIALETLLPSGSTTLSPTAEPVVNNPTEIIHQAGMPFTDPGVQAADNVDGDLSTRVIVGGDTVDPYKPGIYKITYNVVDSAGNRSPQIIRTVVVQDSLKPTITLQGGASIEIEAGSAFNDPGAKASDNLDGDISSNVQAIGEPINVNKLGLYTVVYTVSDGSGNQADPVTRTVRVKDTTAPKITLIGGGGTSSTTAVLPSSAIPVAPQPITNPVTVPSPTSPSLPPPAFPTPAPVVQPQPSTVPFTTTIPKVNPPVPVTPAPTRSPAPITLPTPVSPPVSPTIVPAPAVAPTPPPPTSPFSPPATSVANPIASPFTPPVAPTASTPSPFAPATPAAPTTPAPSPFAPATPAAPTTPAPSPFAPATPAAEPPKPAASPFAPGSNPFAPAAPKATTTSNPFAPSTPVIPKNLIQKNESTGPAIVEKTDSADSKKTAPKPSILPVIAEPEE